MGTTWTIPLQVVDVIFACLDSMICRTELEAFARRFLIPLIDIGMDVHESSGEFSISGQVMLSLPGKPCMRCMGLVTEEALAQEAAKVWCSGREAAGCVAERNLGVHRGWNLHEARDAMADAQGNAVAPGIRWRSADGDAQQQTRLPARAL
jgi:hypothetical protein